MAYLSVSKMDKDILPLKILSLACQNTIVLPDTFQCFKILKWGVSSRWSFGPNSTWPM